MQRFGGLVLGEGGVETILPLVTVTAAAMSLLDDELVIRTRDAIHDDLEDETLDRAMIAGRTAR